MHDREPATSTSGHPDAGEVAARPESGASITDALDALHRASFEAWWLRTHPAGSGKETGVTGRRHTAA